MLQLLLNDIEFNELPINIIQGWLRSLELSFSGDLPARINEHFLDGSIDDDSIAEFLENVKIGGFKTVSVFGLPGTEWDDLDLNSFKRKVQNITTKLGFESFVFDKILIESENKISFQVNQSISYYRVKGGRYEEESLRNVAGEYLAPTQKVDRDLVFVIEINKTKRKIYVWFDAFTELGNELRLHSRKIQAKDMLVRVFGLRNTFNSRVGGNFNRLQNSDLCKLEKIWKTQRARDVNGRQANISFGLVAHEGEGDARHLADTATQEILRDGDAATVTLDYLKLKWLKEQSGNRLIRDIHTTVHKDGTVSFHSFSLKSDIEYVLGNI